MPLAIVPIFVSSTWLDLQPERDIVDKLLRRFDDAKFVGMEYFGSDEGTTRDASLAAVNNCELYIGIIGGRYGSGITEAEYDGARAGDLDCLVYVKAAASIKEEERDKEPDKQALLETFKKRLKDQQTGHLVSQFASPGELTVLVAADLHNWLFKNKLAPALAGAQAGTIDQGRLALRDALDGFTALHRQLVDLVSAQPEVSPQARRHALDILYKLTYDAREQLLAIPGTAEQREEIASANVRVLERLVAANDEDVESLRELATNWRIVAEARIAREDWAGARAAFQESGDACATLVKLAPANALYLRDAAVSHYNIGITYESQPVPDSAAALREDKLALPSVQDAAKLDARWKAMREEIEAAVERLDGA